MSQTTALLATVATRLTGAAQALIRTERADR